MRRSPLFGGLFVVVLVLLAAGGMFALQSAHALAQCSAQPAGATCVDASTPTAALTAVFAAVAGILVAIIMATVVGVNLRSSSQRPSTALAERLEAEERYLETYRLRRAQLDEWTALAKARAAEREAQLEVEGELGAMWTMGPGGVPVPVAGADLHGLAGGPRAWAEEENVPETEQQRKSRVLSEHLAHLKPEAIAAVLANWINQPTRR